MSTPADYDDATITVSPPVLKTAIQIIAGSDPSQSVGGLIGDIIDQLNDIMTTLDGLQLSWVGSSASEANDFSNRWDAAMKQLFGTSNDPSSGVYSRLLDGLAGALTNYDNAEDYVVKLMTAFQSATSSSGSTTSVVNTGGTVVTAITVTY
jgi:uncharacterized protein YukE